MKIALAGASGFVGSAMAQHLNAAGVDVVSFFGRKHINLLDYKAIKLALDTHRPDIIVNAAGNKNVKECHLNCGLALSSNAVIPSNLARVCQEADIKFVHISTDYVFDGQRGWYTENDIAKPTTTYGMSKLAGELFVRSIAESAIIVRTGGLYDVDSPLFSFVINKLENGECVRAFSDVINTPTYIGNLVDAILDLISKGFCGIVNISDGIALSRYGLFQIVADRLGLDKTLLIPVVGEHDDFMLPDVTLKSEVVKFGPYQLADIF